MRRLLILEQGDFKPIIEKEMLLMKHITVNEVRQMSGMEGLVLQGCGGDLNEWVDGINGLLTEAGILKNGDTFKDVYAFSHDGHTNLLFNMADVDLDGGRLAMWRLQTNEQFSGTWLSDYRVNKLGIGVDERPAQNKKPDCALIGQDGNIFVLMGIASRTLKAHGLGDQAKEMSDRITSSGSYTEALGIIGEYVNITSVEGPQERGGMKMRQDF
jgi:hypothetical protein